MFESIDWSSIDGNLILTEIITIFPNCLLIGLFVILALIFRKSLPDILKKITKVGAFGVEVQLGEAQDRLEDAIQDYTRGVVTHIEKEQLNKVIKRAQKIQNKLRGSRILWVDDLPLSNANIHRFLNAFGVVIDNATDTRGAVAAFRWSASAYEVVITDMKRDESDFAGLKLIEELEQYNVTKKVIIFVSGVLPENDPPSDDDLIVRKAYAITDKVYVLLNHVFDLIEDQRDSQ